MENLDVDPDLVLNMQKDSVGEELIKENEIRVRNEFVFEWFQNFHNDHFVLRSIYKFNRNDCLYNLRYLAMVMHLALPTEFEAIIEPAENSFDEMGEEEIRASWGKSYESIEERELNFQFLSSLKQFFKDKGLEFTPILK